MLKSIQLLWIAIALMLGFLGTLTTAHAQQAVRRAPVIDTASDIAKIRTNLLKNYPDTVINDITPTPMVGLYEVVMGRSVAYTDTGGRYLLFGSLVDGLEKTDLTKKRKETTLRTEMSNLPLNQSIKIQQGDGSRSLVVFTDPSCPFCRQLEPELEKLTNVTIHYFLLPLTADTADKTQSIWCAKDRVAAWKSAINGKQIATARCQTPFVDIAALARRVGANGTPTMLSADGRTLQGFNEASGIAAFIAGQPIALAPDQLPKRPGAQAN